MTSSPTRDSGSPRSGRAAGIVVRAATAADAPAISAVIVEALRTTNAADYPPAVIERVAANFTPERVAAGLAGRHTLIALLDGAPVGTGALDGSAVRSIFVHPSAQGRGVGAALMAEIFRLARAAGAAELVLQSSLTATGFYARLGFEAVRERVEGEERTLVMRLRLAPGLPPSRPA